MQCLEVSGAVRPPVRFVRRQRVESKILHTAHSIYICVCVAYTPINDYQLHSNEALTGWPF
jgi:hypothetical protein